MAIPARLNTQSEVLAECDEFGTDTTLGAVDSDTKLGDLGEGGITFVVDTEENEVRSGSQREIYVYIRGATSQLWRGDLLNFNVNNFAFALGQNEDANSIAGAGTDADPYILTIQPERFGEQIERVYYAKGVRVDGMVIRAEANARVFAPSIESTLAQGSPAMIPFVLRVNGNWQIQQATAT